jgi:hypothetical protein
MAADERVHCGRHGPSGCAYVCQHVVRGAGLGFYAANCPNPDDPVADDGDDCPNGWCEECERKQRQCGGWTDESEAFAGVTLVCIHCFDEIRRRNTTGKESL